MHRNIWINRSNQIKFQSTTFSTNVFFSSQNPGQIWWWCSQFMHGTCCSTYQTNICFHYILVYPTFNTFWCLLSLIHSHGEIKSYPKHLTQHYFVCRAILCVVNVKCIKCTSRCHIKQIPDIKGYITSIYFVKHVKKIWKDGTTCIRFIICWWIISMVFLNPSIKSGNEQRKRSSYK